MEKPRYHWVDNTKLFAIVLVALGHLLMGLYDAGVFTAQTYPTRLVQILYLFHVPLFFICSGFLYQRLTPSQDFRDYGKILLKKLISLGVPYFVFSAATYLLKLLFPSAVNNQSNVSLVRRLFLAPLAPYWFLYALFLLFLVSPVLKNSADGLLRLAVSTALFLIYRHIGYGFLPALPRELLSLISDNLFWFVGGMLLAQTNAEKRLRRSGGVLFIAFIPLTLLAYAVRFIYPAVALSLGVLACLGVISFIGSFEKKENPKALTFLARYTTPIFLMHTVFAAATRAVLLKLGIVSLPLHLIAGLTASLVFPVLAGMVMEKIKLDFLYAPTKYIHVK